LRETKTGRHAFHGSRRTGRSGPFWLPAISYYVLSAAISSIVFFLVWGILAEGEEESPWITAGIAASVLMVAAVVLREIILRNARQKYLDAQRRLDRNVSRLSRGSSGSNRRKISLGELQGMLEHISRKSAAANTLGSLGDGHREVFSICDEYLELTRAELRKTDVNSPRFLAMRKGRTKVKRLHKHHLLAWSEIESKALSLEARREETTEGKLEKANGAVKIVESALRFYPEESTLLESVSALREYVSAVGIAGRIEEAETLAKNGSRSKAESIYRDLVEGLDEAHIASEERRLIEGKIKNRLEELGLD